MNKFTFKSKFEILFPDGAIGIKIEKSEPATWKPLSELSERDQRFLSETGWTSSFTPQAWSYIGTPTSAAPYPSEIFVSDIPDAIQKITLEIVGFTHGNGSYVDLLLVSPTGEKSLVMSDTLFQEVKDLNLTFDQEADKLIPRQTLKSAIISGTYKPTNYGGQDPFDPPAPVNKENPKGWITNYRDFNYPANFDVFKGIDPNGIWKLYGMSDQAGRSGKIESWTLNIYTE